MTTPNTTRRKIRAQIKPFSGPQTYPTGWNGYRTFAQIMGDCSPLAAAIMRERYIDNVDIPDALQRGFMVFYEKLSADPDMLADDNKYGVAFPVVANCHANYWNRHRRHHSLEGQAQDQSGDTDEWLLTGLESRRSERWAAWATATDVKLDIENAFARLTEKYTAMNQTLGFRMLVGLYYMTTSVELKDAALIAGISHHYLLDKYVSQVRKDVREIFGEFYTPGMRWIEKYQRGHLEPALQVLERYADNPRMTYAIHTLLEEKSTTEARVNCPWPNSNRFRQRAKEALMKAYRCSA